MPVTRPFFEYRLSYSPKALGLFLGGRRFTCFGKVACPVVKLNVLFSQVRVDELNLDAAIRAVADLV